MVHNYTPIVRWKQGERRGICQLQPTARTGVFPLFQVGPDQYREPTSKSKVGVTAAQELANELKACWGTAAFFLDASALAVPTGVAHHPITDIAAAARAIGLTLTPVSSLGAPSAYQAAIRAIHATDGRGAALRVDLAEFTSANTWASSWLLPLPVTDLIADFRSSIGLVASMGPAVADVFKKLHSGSSWRTVTIAGTSIPGDFSGYSAGLHLIKRTEWALWKALVAAKLPYRLDYGDYMTVSLAAPPSAIAWGYPINAKYTLPDDFLICRGIKTTGRGSIDMAPQLVGHAKSIVGYSHRHRIQNCWADDTIDKMAAGTESPGSLETWVRLSVNRHIERVRIDLP
ncbi:beta family protein [Sphingomonas sp. ASY06-1R]|uniref:beta family protein n=1 Tax=Sphingomonas sp. ASY06-1R TaxID=3445771 RepID=UPI003FA2983B